MAYFPFYIDIENKKAFQPGKGTGQAAFHAFVNRKRG